MTASRTTPGQTSRGFAAAINAGDLEGALEYWADEGLILAADGMRTEGRSQLRGRFAELIAAGAQLEITVSDENETGIGATATTELAVTIGADAGATTTTITTVASVTYVRDDGGFLILSDRIDAPAA